MEYLVPRQFRGEEEVHAEPSGLIKDLGIVFRRGHVRAKMRGLYSGRAATLPGRNFVVNVGAPCNIVIGSTYHLGEGDALDFGICEAAESFTMHAPTGAGDETSGEALGVLISIVD